MDEFAGWDHGFRKGMFHKCNGVDRLNPASYTDNIENEIWFDGYNAGYDQHERMI